MKRSVLFISTLLLAFGLFGSTLATMGCSKDKKKSDAPSLAMENESPACRKALKCCEEMVKLNNGGKASKENINLSCSGVALASTDKECGEFKKGYALTFTSKKKPLPAVCQ